MRDFYPSFVFFKKICYNISIKKGDKTMEEWTIRDLINELNRLTKLYDAGYFH